MEAPNRDYFELKKISLPSSGGVYLEYKYHISQRDEFHEIDDKLQSSVEAHPDLQAKMRSLKDFHMEVGRLKTFYKVINQERFKSSDEQRTIADAALDELKRYIRINKLSISGKDENKGCVITGVVEAETGQGMAFNTHRIQFKGEVYGWEQKLKDIVEDLENEAYEYLFNGKVAEPDMFEESMVEPGEESEDD